MLIFICNLTGYYTVFKILQYQVRDEVKQRIKQSVPEDELVLIPVSITDNNSLIWIKPNKEFLYQEKMYDIVRREIKENQVLYYCIHDFKESKLFLALDEHIQRYINANPIQHKKAGNLLKKVSKNYFFQSFSIKTSPEVLPNSLFKKNTKTYTSICLDIIVPPPKLV